MSRNYGFLTFCEETLNLDFAEKYINFVEQLLERPQRVALFVLNRWKSGVPSFYVRKPSFEERKITLKVVFSKTYALKISTDFKRKIVTHRAENVKLY